MNKNIINYYLSNINKLVESINEKKQQIKKIKNMNANKKIRNEDSFRKIIEQINYKESSIKNLMDNKDFSYIKFIDFIDKQNIYELSGFEINDNGALVEKPEKINPVKLKEKISNFDRTEIIYHFIENSISNKLEYSFYATNGTPIIPQSIIICYDEFEDSFYEPFFRYYNRYISNSFINSFLFTPKKIRTIKFKFGDSINIQNDYCNLLACEYQAKKNKNFATLYFKNPYNLKTFNIFKNSNDSINTIFELTEDNMNFKKIEFNNNEGIFNVENKKEFYIKITSDYSSYKPVSHLISSSLLFNSDNLESENNYSYSFKISGNISDIDIIVPFSSYSKFKEEMTKLDLKIENFIEKVNDLYKIKKDFVKYTTTQDDEILKLNFFDDIAIIKENNKFFMFYVNTNTNKIFFSSFIKEYKLSFDVGFNIKSEQIDPKYFTPMIFDISIKG